MLNAILQSCRVRVAAVIMCLSGLAVPMLAHAEAPPAPAECAALQAKYPQWKGKALVNAINPHTPGYEALDPNDPSKYVGFDIDLGETIGKCLGFTMRLPAPRGGVSKTIALKQRDLMVCVQLVVFLALILDIPNNHL
ncbi:hypothetical protein V4C53_33005, partial [Paraburkholderia azotifigens]